MDIFTLLCAYSRTLPRVRELKHFSQSPTIGTLRRTLPRVRELKLKLMLLLATLSHGRTLPRVRELKHARLHSRKLGRLSHPSQGA